MIMPTFTQKLGFFFRGVASIFRAIPPTTSLDDAATTLPTLFSEAPQWWNTRLVGAIVSSLRTSASTTAAENAPLAQHAYADLELHTSNWKEHYDIAGVVDTVCERARALHAILTPIPAESIALTERLNILRSESTRFETAIAQTQANITRGFTAMAPTLESYRSKKSNIDGLAATTSRALSRENDRNQVRFTDL